MKKTITNFGDTEIEKQKFHRHKRPDSIKNMDIKKMVVFNVSLGKKCFKYLIRYENQTSMSVSPENECILKTKYISFQIKIDELENLEKYNEIWEKAKNSIKKESDSEPVCNKKYLKARITSHNKKINTNIHSNEIPKEGSQFICLSVILIDSFFGTGKNYYPQLF